MPSLTLSGIWIYPVKSLGGISLTEADIGPRGFLYDRHWMLVDSDGLFLSQRKHPRMALIQPHLDNEGLMLHAPEMEPLRVPFLPNEEVLVEVRVWEDVCQAAVCGDLYDEWLSRFLGVEAHLVCLTRESYRQVDQDYAKPEDETGFSDGYPFLLTSEASLADLNRRLEHPVSMRRFRPNLVIQGCGPYAEDTWGRIRIGPIEFRVAKPCSRCTITTVDPESAERGSEPLQTLAKYRKRDNKVYFGQNLIHDEYGKLALGAEIQILEAKFS